MLNRQLTSNISSQSQSIFFSIAFFCFAVNTALKFAGTSHLNFMFAAFVLFLTALNFFLASRVSSSSSISGWNWTGLLDCRRDFRVGATGWALRFGRRLVVVFRAAAASFFLTSWRPSFSRRASLRAIFFSRSSS